MPKRTRTLVDLKIPSLPGFHSFMSSWIQETEFGNVVVDTGPASSLKHLLKELREYESIDYILLTHIHSDHAGGVGDLVEVYPNAKVVIHERSHQHLIDPKRLIEGSKKVLGKTFESFGEIKPVPKQNLITPESCPFDFIYTPGHSADHISFIVEGNLYCGEALGVTFPMNGDKLYLRPATPIRFFPKIYLESIEKLSKLRDYNTINLAHFGEYRFSNLNDLCGIATEQINLWSKIIKCNIDKDNTRLIKLITSKDPYSQYLSELPIDIQKRELNYINNSIKGIKHEF